MLRLFISIILIVVFHGCGVDTSSSAPKDVSNVTETQNDNPIYVMDLIDPNPIVVGVIDNVIDNNVSDNNTSDGGDTPDDGTTTPDDGVVIVPIHDQSDSLFDISGAILDPFGCSLGDINNGYTPNVIKANSDDYLGTNDPEDGIGVNSRYPYNQDVTKTEVAVFYYNLLVSRHLSATSFMQDNYTVSVDNAWGENERSIIYVRTPKDKNDLFGCYRYDLSTMDVKDSVTITKVYRLKE